MRLISSIYVYCAMMWAVYAAPVPAPQEIAPADTADSKDPDPIIRAPNVFRPIDIARAVEIEIEAREHGDSTNNYCVIA
ncbi:hypothetical protein B0H14DRAFT_3482185 [Mycena olivaceomarginata]|nr:hypothetical protein B0H14DRAFT_3482185 [Mycena olivaceomarginata]